MSAAALTEPKINNPHRVQVLVDFPDPTVTVAPAEPIAFPGRRRKFLAVADGDKSIFDLKDVITNEFHRLYAEEAPYGLCQLKNWNYCRIPERYLVRDVLGKECDIHVTRELLSTKKVGKSIKRKVDVDTSSSSSSSSSSALSATVPAAGPSTLTPKSKKHKKEAVAAPAVEAKPKAKTIVKKEAAPKDVVKENAAQTSFDGLTEEQIMVRVSAAAQEKKKASTDTTPETAGSSSSAPASTPKKQKSAKKVAAAPAPTPAKAVPAAAPTPAKGAPKAAAEIKANKKSTPPKDTKDKSEEDIMKEISANFRTQKVKEDMAETIRKAEEIKVMIEVSEKHVDAAEANKEQVETKKERAKKTKAAKTDAKETEVTTKETKETKVAEGIAKETKAAKPKAKETKAAEGAAKETAVTEPKAKAKKTAAPAKESSESAAPAPAKAKKVARKETESDASSESTSVVAKKGATRRTAEDEERLQKLAEQDPATWTEEERREIKLHKKRVAARESHEQQRKARIDAESSDPEIAAAA
ncbi:hypothetical protein BGZ95_003879, partial [Linnemannia exigua]